MFNDGPKNLGEEISQPSKIGQRTLTTVAANDG